MRPLLLLSGLGLAAFACGGSVDSTGDAAAGDEHTVNDSSSQTTSGGGTSSANDASSVDSSGGFGGADVSSGEGAPVLMPTDAEAADASKQVAPPDAAPLDAAPSDAAPLDAVPSDAARQLDATPSDAAPQVDAAPQLDAEPDVKKELVCDPSVQPNGPCGPPVASCHLNPVAQPHSCPPYEIYCVCGFNHWACYPRDCPSPPVDAFDGSIDGSSASDAASEGGPLDGG